VTDTPSASPPPTPTTGALASAPSSTPVSEPTNSASPLADDFSQLGEPDDDFVELASEAPAPAEVAPPPAEPAKPAVEPPKAPEPAKLAQPEVKPPVAPVPEAPKEIAAAAAPPPSEPQALAEQLTEHRAALIDAIASERFKLSPEEMNALEIDAAGAIPKLLSRVYYEAVTASLNHIQNFVPQMQANFRKAEQANAEAEKVFYGAFPTLDKAKHHADVMQFAQLFRTVNPNLSRNDFVAMVGAAVMAKHGIAPGAPLNGKGPSVIPQPAATPPFVPAQAGATVKMTPEEPSPWAGLGHDFEE